MWVNNFEAIVDILLVTTKSRPKHTTLHWKRRFVPRRFSLDSSPDWLAVVSYMLGPSLGFGSIAATRVSVV